MTSGVIVHGAAAVPWGSFHVIVTLVVHASRAYALVCVLIKVE